MKIGDKLKGRITGIQPYGAFVELETGDTGLIHISEIRTGFIENIHEALKVDEEVQVQVVDLDEFTGKASLLSVLWRKKSTSFLDGDAFRVTALTTDLRLSKRNDANLDQGSPSTFEEAEELVRNLYSL